MTTQELLKQTTSSTKIQIICWMFAQQTGITVSELVEKINSERTNISKQIKELKDSGIVEVTQEGRNNFYFLSRNLDNMHIRLLKDIVNSFHIIDENKQDFIKY